ncbi:MAG: hypothetical protein RML12_00805 [Xanthomonadales bacterium]|nr:hypothetical protein [Xanthomonadales bacterium]
MSRLTLGLSLSLLGLAASSAAGACAPTFDLSATPEYQNLDFAADIQPIFDVACVSCHGVLGNLDLSAGQAYANLVNVPSFNPNNAMDRVEPGDPGQSFLFWKLNCSNPGALGWGAMMPLGGPPLAASDQARIMDWIREGAPPAKDATRVFRHGFEARPAQPPAPSP